MSDEMDDVINQVDWLREQVSSKGPQFETGAVVRWVSGRKFTYAAVFAGGRWYITGNASYYGGDVFTTEQFVENVLKDPGARDIVLATEWAVIEA